jgi:hypothetical protein
MAKEITDEEYAQFCLWRDENRRRSLIDSISKKRTRRGREVTLNEVLYGISLDTLARVENEFNPLVETREPVGNEDVTVNVRPQAARNWVVADDTINDFIATLPTGAGPR